MMDRGLEKGRKKVSGDWRESRHSWWAISPKETPFLFVTERKLE